MAMIKCPECEQEISEKAKKCVHCGKILIEEKPATKICDECGKENLVDATECINCGCPFEEEKVVEPIPVLLPQEEPHKKNSKKIIIPIVIATVVVVAIAVGLIGYNIKVIKPKNTYNEALELLEKGKYEEADKLFDTIEGYEDVETIKEQLKYESYAYSSINSLKKYLKNPDSYQPYEITFYISNEKEEDSTESNETDKKDRYPVCVMHYGAQNGFGGNTTGYALCTYNTEKCEYELLGTCDSLDEDDYDKDDEDDLNDLFTCKLINLCRDSEKNDIVGSVDLNRLKTVLKNDAYSSIKIIE